MFFDASHSLTHMNLQIFMGNAAMFITDPDFGPIYSLKYLAGRAEDEREF